MSDQDHPAERPTPEAEPSAEEQEYAYDDGYDDGGGRRGRGLCGCLAVLVALAVLGGGGYVVATKGTSFLRDHLSFSSAPDYPGPGRGKLTFEVKQGDTVGAIGRALKAKGVVKSVDAFTAAAGNSTGIQVGAYQLKKKMKASDAFGVLKDPSNILKNTVTIPEGLRVVDIVAILAASTKYSTADFSKVLADPSRLGLPSYAGGNPEGYLFPSTYDFTPKEKPVDMLTDMVKRWRQAASDANLESAAAALGKTPAELMTIASLVEAEGRGSDMPKISRVLYNRLDNPQNGVTNGLLQVDATVNYALHRKGVVAVTTDETLNTDSPYNTYQNPGLPPTPIEAPGDAALKAAAHPADGNWLFYVTVNLRTGETKFTDSYNEFLSFKQELQTYCTTSDAC
ncbi:MAG: endolytic transglycosylase MltG [Nocardioides sp.]